MAEAKLLVAMSRAIGNTLMLQLEVLKTLSGERHARVQGRSLQIVNELQTAIDAVETAHDR